jgi:cytidylate kinase
MIITIDGPAGSGKSSTAKAVAARLGFKYLDSGAFYRALTFTALRAGIDPMEWPHLAPTQIDQLGVHGQVAGNGFHLFAHGEDITHELRSADVNAHVSLMARIPAVRTWLLERQREVGRAADLVADGRDLGTVVFPDADLKIFLTADPRARARRRLAEQGVDAPSEGELADAVAQLGQRDRIDSEREVAPLRQAEDAALLDTTELSFEQQVEKIVKLARERTNG